MQADTPVESIRRRKRANQNKEFKRLFYCCLNVHTLNMVIFDFTHFTVFFKSPMNFDYFILDRSKVQL
jgi:hypothetical protein